MSKITLADLASLANTNTAVTAINANSALIETAFDNTISRDGTSPNEMNSDLDMNSNRILNLPEPTSDLEPLRVTDLDSFINGTVTFNSLPQGGTAGQLLVKSSSTNFDAAWTNVVSGGLSTTSIVATSIAVSGTSVFSGAINYGGVTLSNAVTGTGKMVLDSSPSLTGVSVNGTGLDTNQPIFSLNDINTTNGVGFQIVGRGRDTDGNLQDAGIINPGLTVNTAGAWQGDVDFVAQGYGPDLTTNGTTSAGNPTLHFASVPTWVTPGMLIFNKTTPTSIPASTTVLSKTTTTIVMSANATGAGVGSANAISLLGALACGSFTGVTSLTQPGGFIPCYDNAINMGWATQRWAAVYAVLGNYSEIVVNGPITNSPGASVTPTVNGQVTWQLTDNTHITFKAKGSDGTVRSAALVIS